MALQHCPCGYASGPERTNCKKCGKPLPGHGKITPPESMDEAIELEKAILECAKGFKVWRNSRLSERAIVVLLHDATGVGKKEIALILKNAANLDALYLKKD